MGGIVHLTRRFVGSLSPRLPPAEDIAWVESNLGPGERNIWNQMSPPDKRHSVTVARAVEARVAGREIELFRLDDATSEPVPAASEIRRQAVAAALLHDSGKLESGLGTLARVAATLVRPLIARWRYDWGRPSRWLGRFHLYWNHPEIGGEALRQAGAKPLVSQWAAEHHMPPERWSVPPALGRILAECDDD